MRTAEHLTIEQLHDYAADTVEKPARREIGAHLINCPDCRARLPKPSTEQFLAALFTENTIGENGEAAPTAQADSRRLEKRSIFNVSESLFRIKTLALGAAGAFVLLAGFLLAGWWMTATKNSGGSETANLAAPQLPAAVMENKNAAPEQTPLIAQTGGRDLKAQQPTNKNSIAKTGGNTAEPQKRLTGDARVSERPNIITQQSRGAEIEPQSATEREIAALLEKTPASVASLRSNGTAVLRSSNQPQPATSEQSFALTFPVGETVLDAQPEFRWQSVPAAKSYRISIQNSSYDEVASVTVNQPAFKLDKPLARGTIYLWRVTAKTDAGSEIIAPQPPKPPARFRVADEKTEKQIAESQKRADDKLARAALLAREGMLDSAARLLREILRENPRHKSARRLLSRVEEWQRTAR